MQTAFRCTTDGQKRANAVGDAEFDACFRVRKQVTATEQAKFDDAQKTTYNLVKKRRALFNAESDKKVKELINTGTELVKNVGVCRSLEELMAAITVTNPSTKAQRAILKFLHVQVRYWRELVFELFSVNPVKLPNKPTSDMTYEECMQFLESVYTRIKQAVETTTMYDGRTVLMRFTFPTRGKTKAHDETWHGTIKCRVPFDKTNTWFFIQFEEDSDHAFPYHIPTEIAEGNVVNAADLSDIVQH